MSEKVICPLNDFLPESIEFSQKPIIIPPLQTLLSNSSESLQPSNDYDPSLCEYILLHEQIKKNIQEFKLFRENEIPLFSQNITNVQLNDLGYDNDDDTDNEQIRRGSKLMYDSLTEALSNYKEKSDIVNIEKYRDKEVQ